MWMCLAVKSVMLSLHTWATIPGVFRYDNYLTSDQQKGNMQTLSLSLLQFPHSKVTYLEP